RPRPLLAWPARVIPQRARTGSTEVMKQILGRTAVAGAALLASAVLAGCGPGPATRSGGSAAGGSGSAGGDGGAFRNAKCMASGAPVALAIGTRSNNPTPSLSSLDSSLV